MEEFFQDEDVPLILLAIEAAHNTLEVLLDAVLFLAAFISHESFWLIEDGSSVEELRAIGVKFDSEDPVRHIPVVQVEHVATLLLVLPVSSVGREVRKFKVERKLGRVLQRKMPVDFWLGVAELLGLQSGHHACLASECRQIVVELGAKL